MIDLVAVERDLADAVALAFGERDAQLDPARVLVLGVFERLDLRLPDARLDVALFAVVGFDLLGVFFELRFLEGAAAGDPREEPLGLGLLHLAFQLAVAERLIADEVDGAHAAPSGLR